MSVKSQSIQSKKQTGQDERLKKISPLRVLLNRPELGALGGSILVFMLATRLIPAVNIWEQKEMLLYKAEVQFHRTKVMVMGKSR